MLLLLLLLTVNFDIFNAYLHYSYDENERATKKARMPTRDVNFEPVVNLRKEMHTTVLPSINCEDFTSYAKNCTFNSALIYNSSKRSPPMPAKMTDWCRAIQHLTNCAIDWNNECKDVTESHFNEESIRGHMHVVRNICEDEYYLARYDELPDCIERVTSSWELCYVIFKASVDLQKNASQEWTHYETHFQLCCARAKFRRCTLDALFIQKASMCLHKHAFILQKFSVIVSEGDVYQNCDDNVMYTNCPGGDPRPPNDVIFKLTNAIEAPNMNSSTPWINRGWWIVLFLIVLVKLCL